MPTRWPPRRIEVAITGTHGRCLDGMGWASRDEPYRQIATWGEIVYHAFLRGAAVVITGAEGRHRTVPVWFDAWRNDPIVDRLAVSIVPQNAECLDHMIRRLGVTLTEAIRRLAIWGMVVHHAHRRGAVVGIVEPEGTRRLVPRAV